jgi:hypothetical protein
MVNLEEVYPKTVRGCCIDSRKSRQAVVAGRDVSEGVVWHGYEYLGAIVD